MKKLLSVLILLSFATIATAQDYELYNCGYASSRNLLSSGNYSEWTRNKTDFIIRLCIKENKLEFNNKAGSIFYFGNILSQKSSVDSDGDKYTITEWNGYDEDGLKCHLVDINYTTLRNRTFVLEYNDMEFSFECLILNKSANNQTI